MRTALAPDAGASARLAIPALLFALASLCWAAGGRADDAQDVDFQRQIVPLLVSHCLECHGQSDPAGDLSLSRQATAQRGGVSGPAVVAGDPEASELWQMVASDQMPPEEPLAAAEKQLLRRWIEQGAPWSAGTIDPFASSTEHRAGRDWWSLQTLRSVSPPELSPSEETATDQLAARQNRLRNPIDHFVLAARQRQGIAGPLLPSAEPRDLVRRLYFDLLGLPPAPEAVAKFAADPSEVAYRRLVDRLLASPQYGQRWARHWLDVVRFGESDGFERNQPRDHAWPYRDWVIDAFNRDMPYDQFVRWQLVGDQMDSGWEGAAATGFWVAGVHNTVVGGSPRMRKLARQDEVEDVLGTVGQTFLGMTINCARCHDHKFDPITQQEYYQLASAVSGLGFGQRVIPVPVVQQRLQRIGDERQAASAAVARIDAAARAKLAAQATDAALMPTSHLAPIAAWEFDDDLRDAVGGLHGRAHGDVRFDDGALVLDGTNYVDTPPLAVPIEAKTFEVWLRLDNLQQRGGAAISLATLDGVIFDAVVFGEQQPGHWMAGSNRFVRTGSFAGSEETVADGQPVHIAIVYDDDGTIHAYRNGIRYGHAVRKAPLQRYQANQSEVVFGLRHKPAAQGRFLAGKLYRAALYDRALTTEQVADLAARPPEYVSAEQISAVLTAEQRRERATQVARLQQLQQQQDRLQPAATRQVYTLVPGKGEQTHVLLRGDPDNVGPLVAPAGIAALCPDKADFGLQPDAGEAQRRRKLADWITAEDNPLFARVMVNRLWHYHFGTGIVDTPNDFGFGGGRPSHAELLDYLAHRFREAGYRLKPLHRQIVTSQTYRQTTRIADTSFDRSVRPQDADNRLLWRGPVRRLEAETIRDALLSVAGQLNRAAGGPSFRDVSVTYLNGTTYYEPIDAVGGDVFRRTVYRFNPRGGRSALLDTFDCPDPAASAPRRAVTTTPLQALSLLNNVLVLRMTDAFAARLRREAGADVSAQIDRAWQLAIARSPSPAEQQLSRRLVEQHGLEALCRGLFNLNEFVVIQ